MADFNSEDNELTTPYEEEITDFLQTDLNLRTLDWTNSTSNLLNEDETIVEESIAEEIVLDSENEGYLINLEENNIENSIVYLYKDPVADYTNDEPQFIIEETLTYNLEPLETNIELTEVGDTMDSNFSQDNSSKSDSSINVDENIVQETSIENSENVIVNNISESGSLKSTILSDNVISDLKNISEVDNLPIEEYKNIEKSPESSLSVENEPVPFDNDLKFTEFQSPKVCNSIKNIETPVSLISLKTPNNMTPALLESKSEPPRSSSPEKYPLDFNVENFATVSSNYNIDNLSTPSTNTVKTSVLGKDQIKKRLQSFSLMKQGIQPLPIKKIITKSPKIQVQVQNDYDELGNQVEDKLIIIKKPPKQGPTPQERARAVIDEIEQIKREEQAIYEENLTFISNSMREAIKKSKKTAIEIDEKYSEKERSFERKVKKYDKDYSKRRNRRSLDNERNDKKRNKSREQSIDKSEKSRDSSKDEEKRFDEMPQSWKEMKSRNIEFRQINRIKDKLFKFSDIKSPVRYEKKGPKRYQEDEKQFSYKKEDFVKPQVMFEYPSLLRNPLAALSVAGSTKYFPAEAVKFTEKYPIVSFCENPVFSANFLKTRKQIFSENPSKRNELMMKIIENKTGITEEDMGVASCSDGIWYPKNSYLIEAKPDTTNIKSNALLVLSEMYEDEDDLDQDKDKNKNKEKSKQTKTEKSEKSEKKEKSDKKSKKKKSKRKKKKLKSRSRSNSLDKSKDSEHKKSKSSKKNSKKLSEEPQTKKLDENKPQEEKPVEKEKSKSVEKDKPLSQDLNKSVEYTSEKQQDENTPNTEEYRSNWESDEDILNIIRVENQFSKDRDNSLDKNWGSDNETQDKFQNRRKNFNKNDKRKVRRSRSISEDHVKRKQEIDLRKQKGSFTKDDENSRSRSVERDKKHSRLRNESLEETDFDNKKLHDNKTDEKKSDKKKSRESRWSLFDEKSKQSEIYDKKDNEKSYRSADIDYKRESEHKHSKDIEEKSHNDNKSRSRDRNDSKYENKDKFRNNDRYDSKKSIESYRNSSRDRNISEEKTQNRPRDFDIRRTNFKLEFDEKSNYEIRRSVERRHEFDEKTRKISDYNKWSSEEDIYNKRKSTVDHPRVNKNKHPDENEIKLNLNYNKRFQWSDDEDFDKKRNVDFRTNKNKTDIDKSRNIKWEDDLEIQCRNLEEEIGIKRHNLLNFSKNFDVFDNLQPKDEKEFDKDKRKKYKDDKKFNENKTKDKKLKDKDKNKREKQKIVINYSDFEDTLEEEFQEKKEDEKKNVLFDANEIFPKYKAKIKIDYTDFDMSLNESKEKFEESVQRNTPEQSTSSNKLSITTSVKKMNLDLSEILDNKLKTEPVKDEKLIDIASDKSNDNIVDKSLTEPSTSLPTSELPTEITPVVNIPELPKPLIEIPGPVVPSNPVAQIFTPILEISPIVPPLLIPPSSQIKEIPATGGSDSTSKLASEYEEFMKAVCFDEAKDEITTSTKPADNKKAESKSDASKNVEVEKISDQDSSDSSSSDDDDNSSDDSSDTDDLSDDTSGSELSERVVLETVANIKTEILSDSENSEHKTDKRKRNEISESENDFMQIKVKTEQDNANRKAKRTNFDKNIIDWEHTFNIDIPSENIPQKIQHTHDVFDIGPSTVVTENIPLPQEDVFSLQSIPIPDEFPIQHSPKIDTISISSDSSPAKKSRAFIPIKLLTDSRKEIIEIDNRPLEEKIVSHMVSSSETSHIESAESLEDDLLSNRKRHSQWNLNLTPAKKPLLQTAAAAFNQDDSDEDFTDKFVKQPEKKSDKPISDPVSDKLETSEPNKDRPPADSHKSVKSNEKSLPQNNELHSSSLPNNDKSIERSRQTSRERIDKKYEKNRRDKRDSFEPKNNRPRERSLERHRDRSPDRNRDRMRRDIRDRDKRRSNSRSDRFERRLSDRKSNHPRGGRSRYSRDRSPIRPRDSIPDRSKDRNRNDRRDSRDLRDHRDHRDLDRSRDNYRRDKYSHSPSPARLNSKSDYRSLEHPPGRPRPDDTDFSTHSMDLVQSPVNSPLDGFKRSLADSTISDSELLTQQITPDEGIERSPGYSQTLHNKPYYPQRELQIQRLESPCSPKRISLDDRINLVLGIEKEPPKQIDTVCTRGPFTNTTSNYHQHDIYGYGRQEYEIYNAQPSEQYPPAPYHNQYHQPTYYQNPINTENNVKVVQVGNVIQVVPTEQPIVPPPNVTPVPKAPEAPPKVVQVGNMLQIVPMTIIDTPVINSPTTTTTAPPITTPEKPAVTTKPIDQLVIERRAEKEKRRLEREQRRKEKEKKRKEKEKRRQLKYKLKTENMIKKALMLETGEVDLDISNTEPEIIPEVNETKLPQAWPPSASVILSLPLPKPPSKGILVSHGFREKEESLTEELEIRKVVKFADGVCPGEGTSPSGGEELPSPPPPPRKLPKEKRYKKVKLNKNKKKIKVKIIRTQQQTASDSSDTEDNLPPPPPPPGSPPPHLWPPRIKQPPVNNIHPQLNVPGNSSGVYPPPGTPYVPSPQIGYPGGYPPSVVMGQPPLPTLQGQIPMQGPPRNHHPPVMPVLQPGAPPPPPPHHGPHHGAPSFHH